MELSKFFRGAAINALRQDFQELNLLQIIEVTIKLADKNDVLEFETNESLISRVRYAVDNSHVQRDLDYYEKLSIEEKRNANAIFFLLLSKFAEDHEEDIKKASLNYHSFLEKSNKVITKTLYQKPRISLKGNK